MILAVLLLPVRIICMNMNNILFICALFNLFCYDALFICIILFVCFSSSCSLMLAYNSLDTLFKS
uniref:Uncharacterized protein n=2 Tax=unclassified Microvirus TaxID=338099 RepID=A0AAU8B1U1_9VIRU